MQSDLFQDDLYPDTAGPEAAMEAEEWVAGRTAGPVLVSLRQAYVPSKQRDLKVNRRTLLHENRPAPAAAAGPTTPPPTPPAAPAPTRLSAPPALGSVPSAPTVCMGWGRGVGGAYMGGAGEWVRSAGWGQAGAMGVCVWGSLEWVWQWLGGAGLGRWAEPLAVGAAVFGWRVGQRAGCAMGQG